MILVRRLARLRGVASARERLDAHRPRVLGERGGEPEPQGPREGVGGLAGAIEPPEREPVLA